MVLRKLIMISKPLTPLLLGVCLGITLSLFLSPGPQGGCSVGRDKAQANMGKAGMSRKTNSLAAEDFDYGNSDDFEPRLRVLEKVKVGKGQNTLLRTRYASTELGIREKLFVGVLTSKQTIDTLGVAINKTLNQYMPKLVFFMNSRGPVLPSGMSVVIFSNEESSMVPFHMIKYISDHYVKTYDWFYFMTDDTYVRGENLMEFVENCSISNDFYVGKSYSNPSSGEVMCNIDGGILLSQQVISAAIDNLSWCRSNSISDDRRLNLGQCLLQASKEHCVDKVETMQYSSYDLSAVDIDLLLQRADNLPSFKHALTVQHIPDDVTMYKLHRYYCELALNETHKELRRLQHEMVSLAPQTPEGEEGITWPIGIDPPSHEATRHDVLKWEYFTDTQLYLHSELVNGKPLSGVDKIDVQDVIRISVEQLNEKYTPRRFSLHRLVNGYRRFDPGRGMQYLLDLGLKVKGSEKEVIKRVHLLRPLSQVEIVPMPYVTESSRVNLILPVKIEDRDNVVSFLDSYAVTCLDTGDNTHLYVVFLYNDANPMQTGDEDSFSVLKSMMSFYESKYQNGARIAWTALHNNHPTQFTVMDAISKKFSKETLFLLCSVGMELSIEFLNRVRMNTISSWQVFFPIAFWQYKPNLIYDKHPYPTDININAETGHFDANMFVHASFYNADYQYARKQMISTSGAPGGLDLYDVFIKYHNLHVFRAVDPALKHRFKERTCSTTSGGAEHNHECTASQDSSLGSRQQLAMIMFEQQNSLDEAQLNVLHQQQDPKIDPMKPNMLKRK